MGIKQLRIGSLVKASQKERTQVKSFHFSFAHVVTFVLLIRLASKLAIYHLQLLLRANAIHN